VDNSSQFEEATKVIIVTTILLFKHSVPDPDHVEDPVDQVNTAGYRRQFKEDLDPAFIVHKKNGCF